MSDLPALIIDDEAHACAGLSAAIESLGLPEPATCTSMAEARSLLAGHDFAMVLLDLHLGDGSGEDLLSELAVQRPGLPVVVVTGSPDVSTAVRCLRGHAADYLLKPVDALALEATLRRVLAQSELDRENRALAHLAGPEPLIHPEAFDSLITFDAGMLRLMRYAEVVAPGRQPVLITGETGTGKELMARALHRLSGRAGRFVPVNAAGLDESTFSDALFGHRRGAFTGADGERAGLVAQADGGTLFLDEIGDLPETAQVRLLRLLQDGEYYPIGSDRPLRSTSRIIAATNRDLEAATHAGRFRPDLYYRLHAHRLRLPPLRERRGDIPALIHHFLPIAARDLSLAPPAVAPAAIAAAQAMPWPGNVRELASAVHEAVGRQRTTITAFGDGSTAPAANPGRVVFPEVLPTLDEMRDLLVAEALRRTGGGIPEASRMLGLSRWGLSKRLKSVRGGPQDGCDEQLKGNRL